MRWFIVEDKRKTGPFSALELKQKLRAGEIALDTLVAKDGSPVKRRVMDVPEILDATTKSPISQPGISLSPNEASPPIDATVISRAPGFQLEFSSPPASPVSAPRRADGSQRPASPPARPSQDQETQLISPAIDSAGRNPFVAKHADARTARSTPEVAKFQPEFSQTGSDDAPTQLAPERDRLRSEPVQRAVRARDQGAQAAAGTGQNSHSKPLRTTWTNSLSFDLKDSVVIPPGAQAAEREHRQARERQADRSGEREPQRREAPEREPQRREAPRGDAARPERSAREVRPAPQGRAAPARTENRVVGLGAAPDLQRQGHAESPRRDAPEVREQSQVIESLAVARPAEFHWQRNRMNSTSAQVGSFFKRSFLSGMGRRKKGSNAAGSPNFPTSRILLVVGAGLIIGVVIFVMSLYRTEGRRSSRGSPATRALENARIRAQSAREEKPGEVVAEDFTEPDTDDEESSGTRVAPPPRRNREVPRKVIPPPRREARKDPVPPPVKETKPQPRPRANESARGSGFPAGWPTPAVNRRSQLEAKKFTVATVDTLVVQNLPALCSPCRINGTLPDGTTVALVSPGFAPWKTVRRVDEIVVAVKGLLRKEADGEFSVIVQGIYQR